MKVESVESNIRAVGVGVAVAAAVICSALSGCAVPALLGVKSYQSGDTRIEFITGVDFGIGMNGIDQVQNSRGIKPEQKQATKVDAKY